MAVVVLPTRNPNDVSTHLHMEFVPILLNKKDIVTSTLTSNDIDICCLQETEIPSDFPIHILNSKKYCLEAEQNSVKKELEFM